MGFVGLVIECFPTFVKKQTASVTTVLDYTTNKKRQR